jgi:hypothetical protein
LAGISFPKKIVCLKCVAKVDQSLMKNNVLYIIMELANGDLIKNHLKIWMTISFENVGWFHSVVESVKLGIVTKKPK